MPDIVVPANSRITGNNYSEGYSGRGGQARNPYNLTVNPGGSSTGSATAVSANIVPFALGTETDGSGKSRRIEDQHNPLTVHQSSTRQKGTLS